MSIANIKAIVLYHEQLSLIRGYSDEQLGKLLSALIRNTDGEDAQAIESSLQEPVLTAYRFIALQIKIDDEKYQQLCEKRRAAANKRWAKNDDDANAFFAMHNKNKNKNKNENKNKNKNKNENKNEINKESLVDSLRRDSSSSSAVSGDANGGEEDEEDNFSRMIKEKFMPWWNQLVKDYDSNIKPLRIMTEKRIERLRQICDTYGKDILFEVCRKALASPFLNGKGKNANFIATFNWIIDEKNFLNVLEGNYYTK